MLVIGSEPKGLLCEEVTHRDSLQEESLGARGRVWRPRHEICGQGGTLPPGSWSAGSAPTCTVNAHVFVEKQVLLRFTLAPLPVLRPAAPVPRSVRSVLSMGKRLRSKGSVASPAPQPSCRRSRPPPPPAWSQPQLTLVQGGTWGGAHPGPTDVFPAVAAGDDPFPFYFLCSVCTG